jgi:hypothetical protein
MTIVHLARKLFLGICFDSCLSFSGGSHVSQQEQPRQPFTVLTLQNNVIERYLRSRFRLVKSIK